MPPRCCTQDHIPLRHVDRLFSDKFKMQWNRKYQEYTTKNRIYCPARGCGEWIKPSNIYNESGRKCGKCSRCKTKVCCLCNGKWHTKRECPKDEETNRFVEIAKQEGWKRCHNCSAMIELKEGCNHMTCRCTAEFCMICGAKWKTCNCPWFNYNAVEVDRLQHMNVPVARRVPIHAEQEAGGARGAPVNFVEEMATRRRQEVRDEALARRLQDFNLHEDDAALLAAVMAHNNGGAAAHGIQDPAAPPLRRHTTASRRFNAAPARRPSERLVPARAARNDYAAEADRHRPLARVTRTANDGEVRLSRMAGLTREGRPAAGGRVGEWLRHVEAGLGTEVPPVS
ncbi:MAG: hypothetical protein M1825_000751 [Sarcosagium campestre]|nr:MAG: hypothetical protein M1825_000751 [Sarcosagium campestre]